MSHDESNGSKPSELSRLTDEIAAAKQALVRLGSAVLKVHYAQTRTDKTAQLNNATLERIERKAGNIGEALAVIAKKVDDTEDAIDKVSDEISQPIALPTKADLSIEQHVEAAKTWLTFIIPFGWKAVVIVLMIAGWALHLARWLLHAK